MVRRFIASPTYTQSPTTQTEQPAKLAVFSVVKADDPGNLPSLAIFPPNHHKLEGAAVILALLLMAKLMFPDLDGSVALDRIDLEAALHHFSRDFRGAREELGKTLTSLRIFGQSARVVIKLQIVGEERHQRCAWLPSPSVRRRLNVKDLSLGKQSLGKHAVSALGDGVRSVSGMRRRRPCPLIPPETFQVVILKRCPMSNRGAPRWR